ncbi:hypothetical protein [Hyphomicrobium sp. ghe19]|uniref:hypothetical protein n=1 Tax=Hyphomicrobium sp. ghe19 TaxID=2682968 RepID=UPI001366F607|nr:hypothetical protein HYPP_03785 [Hyphomicrobium sp. ghe19]
MEFQKWLDRLARLIEYGFNLPDGDGAKYIATGGVTCWREMFDGGLSPEDALEKEFAAARH